MLSLFSFSFFFLFLFHCAFFFCFSCFYALNKTPIQEIGCLSYPQFLLAAQASSFLILTHFQTQSVRSPLLTCHSLLSICVTYEASCCSIAHQLLPTQPLPREAGGFTRGGKYVKQVPLSTYLVSHQNCKTWQVLFYVLGSVTEHYINPHWFSIHFLTT